VAIAVEYKTVLTDEADGVGTVTLNRPEHMNAYTARLGLEMRHAISTFDARDDIRAIVVTGAGRAFCAGADLSGGADTFGGHRPGSGRDGAGLGRRPAGRGPPRRPRDGPRHRRQRRPRLGRHREAPRLRGPGRARPGRRPGAQPQAVRVDGVEARLARGADVV